MIVRHSETSWSLTRSGTVNTVPEATLIACAEHGAVCDLLEPDEASAAEVFATVRKAGIDVDGLVADLQDQGADAFASSWATLLACIATKITGLETANA